MCIIPATQRKAPAFVAGIRRPDRSLNVRVWAVPAARSPAMAGPDLAHVLPHNSVARIATGHDLPHSHQVDLSTRCPTRPGFATFPPDSLFDTVATRPTPLVRHQAEC